MAARFEVHRAFALEDRGLFALAGAIREGTVHVGMTATLEGAGEAFRRPVHGVEFLEGQAGADPRSGPCLTFGYRREEVLEAWLGLDWEGSVLELSW